MTIERRVPPAFGWIVTLGLLAGSSAEVAAQERPAESAEESNVALGDYLTALSEQRLIAAQELVDVQIDALVTNRGLDDFRMFTDELQIQHWRSARRLMRRRPRPSDFSPAAAIEPIPASTCGAFVAARRRLEVKRRSWVPCWRHLRRGAYMLRTLGLIPG